MKQQRTLIISFSIVVLVAVLLYARLYPETSILPRFSNSSPGVLAIEADQSIVANEPFELKIHMDTMGQEVNAAGVYLHFDPQKLQVLEMDTQRSFCQFYPEKKFDNNEGTISLACGSPHPGFKGLNTLLIMKFIPLSVGTSSIRIDPKSQLLASDGKGTDLLEAYPSIDIQISNKL